MWILFDGVFGIEGGSRDRRDAAADGVASECREPGRKEDAPVAARDASTFEVAVGSGGGYGEIEIPVTDAECAW